VALTMAGYTPIIYDNLFNSHLEVLNRLKLITQQEPIFVQGDVRDRALIYKTLVDKQISSVIHFAGLKAVGESVSKPVEYYDNNVRGTLELVAAMRDADVRTLVFSSSATVYGDPSSVPIREAFPLSATNPYGRSKLMVEEILTDLSRSDSEWRIACLRYFNPVGAHITGLIGEDPQGIPNNLVPFIAQVAVGRREFLRVFGGDYPTPDGTGVRDYIHVVDLAEGHVAALDYLASNQGAVSVNLGTGKGASVLEMVAAFEKASGRKIAYQITDRRPGDIAQCWADPMLAKEKFGWTAVKSIEEMCEDAWRWQVTNPDGFTIRRN
jgi:UDP-glucose 4-epimerase